MSARRPFATVLRSAGRPTTTPMASRSAVVSVMITSITMVIETIAATWKVGAPKWNGVEIANVLRLAHLGEVDLADQRGDDARRRPGRRRIAIREKKPGQEPVDHQDDRPG